MAEDFRKAPERCRDSLLSSFITESQPARFRARQRLKTGAVHKEGSAFRPSRQQVHNESSLSLPRPSRFLATSWASDRGTAFVLGSSLHDAGSSRPASGAQGILQWLR